jgi:hypothetical protein
MPPVERAFLEARARQEQRQLEVDADRAVQRARDQVVNEAIRAELAGQRPTELLRRLQRAAWRLG